jgi:LacI family transcriptional regulator
MSKRVPTVYEVAALAGVSTATVHRVLAGNDRVRPERRDRVLAAVAELGYVPSGAARDLAARRTGVLGLCFPDLIGEADDHAVDSNAVYWYDEVIRGMERAARRTGYAVLIAASDDLALVTSVAGRCDAMVVLGDTVSAAGLAQIARRIPVAVLAGRRGDAAPVLDHLLVDNVGGARDVTAHLLDVHRLRDPWFVAGPDSPDAAARFEGFQAALAERGLPVPERPQATGDFTTVGGRKAVGELLAAGHRPSALVCANDQTAIGAMAALEDAGVRVPKDVAVTGFDGLELGWHVRPSLTTVAQPMRRLGVLAVDMLLERLRNPEAAAQVVELPVRLELRASCGCEEPAA